MYRLKFFDKHFFNKEDRPQIFDRLWNLRPITIVTQSTTTDVALIRLENNLPSCDSGDAFRKRYRYPSFRRKLKGFFRNTFFGSSRAKREFENLTRLYQLGLNEVKPLAFGEDRFFRFLHRAFILTESLPDTCELNHFLKSPNFFDMESRSQSKFLTALGRWVAMLHARGYRDRDLHARNILVHAKNDGWRFSKIDSPKGSGGRLEPRRARTYLKDLKDLDEDLQKLISRQGRLRCALAYLGAGDVDGEVRELLDNIL